MKYLIIALFLTSCVRANEPKPKRVNNPNILNNIVTTLIAEKVWTPNGYHLDSGLHRYENNEVICYVLTGYRKGGLSCKWKKTKD